VWNIILLMNINSVVVATGSECIVVKGEFIGGEIKTGCTDGLWNV